MITSKLQFRSYHEIEIVYQIKSDFVVMYAFTWQFEIKDTNTKYKC